MQRSVTAGLWLVSLLLGGAFLAQPARAEYSACNETSYILEVAVGTISESVPTSEGWFIVPPGECRQLLRTSLHEETELFAYARSTDIYGEEGIYFSGDTTFCVKAEDFLIEGGGLCPRRSHDHVRFSSIAFEGADWTTYFSEEKGYDRETAKIAGLQRLLDRLGYSVGEVDGIQGARTRMEIDAFREEHDVGEEMDALFHVMSEVLEERLKENGLEVCNRSDYRVWAAVGIGRGDGADVETRGWRYADAGHCVTILQELLDDRDYYLFAESVDENGFTIRQDEKDKVWGGEHSFCVSTIRFVITRQGECDTRNFDQRGFYRLNIEDAAHFVETLE